MALTEMIQDKGKPESWALDTMHLAWRLSPTAPVVFTPATCSDKLGAVPQTRRGLHRHQIGQGGDSKYHPTNRFIPAFEIHIFSLTKLFSCQLSGKDTNLTLNNDSYFLKFKIHNSK